MKQAHSLRQQLAIRILVISLCLKSCSNGNTPILSIQQEQTSNNLLINNQAPNNQSISLTIKLVPTCVDQSQTAMQLSQMTQTQPILLSSLPAYLNLASSNMPNPILAYLEQDMNLEETGTMCKATRAWSCNHICLSNADIHQQHNGQTKEEETKSKLKNDKEKESMSQSSKRKREEAQAISEARQTCGVYKKTKNSNKEIQEKQEIQDYKVGSRKSVKHRKLENLAEPSRQVKYGEEDSQLVVLV